MSIEFTNKIKIYQIIESQLPQFIRDDVTTLQQSEISISGSGVYTRSGKSVTITSQNHGLQETNRLKLQYISGSGTDGFYSVRNVVDNNTFIVDDEVSGKTSGTVNYEQYATVIGLEPSTIQNIPGSYAKFIEFLKQYYISQEYQSGPVDLIDNLDQYLKLDNLIPEVIVGVTTTTSNIQASSTVINVESTKGFPDYYGLLKIDDEIITYTSKTAISFLGCIRGFSGILNYSDELNPEELVFSNSESSSHSSDSQVENLSVKFLHEFYKKIKYSLVPGLEDLNFIPQLNVGNFIKEARSLYESKGTEESFKILFKILYGVEPKVIDLEQYLIKSSDAKFVRREVSVAERITGNPSSLIGQVIFKNGDPTTSASVSEVQTITKNGKTYYKLYLFVGYDDVSSSIIGNFNITPSTKVSKNTSVDTTSSSTITVDSTVGFPKSGFFYYDQKKIYYLEKSINQFFGCYTDYSSQIDIEKTKNITTSETYYGYEDGDTTKKVDLRLTGVLSDITFSNNVDSLDIFNYIDGDEVFVRNLGEVIENPNPENGITYKQVIANSWIYNTNCRFQVDSNTFSGNQFNIFSIPDKSNLKIGDKIEFLFKGTELVIPEFESVTITSKNNNLIVVNEDVSGLSTYNVDLRRIQNTASSLSPIKYGNNQILSDVLNVYSDNNDFLYVASNSLPSYDINVDLYSYQPLEILQSSYNPETEKYSVIKFNEILSFLTGDKIYYTFTNEPIKGLEEREYYVEVSQDKSEIKLYSSKSLIGTTNFIEFGDANESIVNVEHNFVLFSQKDLLISPQKTLRKFKINPDPGDQYQNPVISGPVGMLVNGVEILSYQTNDKIYYGPIESISILNSGTDYDVINPPLVQFSYGNAKIQPVISGKVQKILIDPLNFDVGTNVSVSITGGNGTGAEFEPIVAPFQREIDFDARPISSGGGLDFSEETISFNTNHNLVDGQQIFYDSNGNNEIGIGSYKGFNIDSGLFLVSKGSYFAKIINSVTIQLHPTFSDFSSGINTIGITSIGNSGIHKFKTEQTNTLKEVQIVNGGMNYTNRKLLVNPSGISTQSYTINFINHGFNNGDLVEYKYENIGILTAYPISGLSTTKNYNILKIDSNSFRICDAGIGGTDNSNYLKQKYVKFDNTGQGYQVFKFPDISVNISYSIPGIGTTSSFSSIISTPVVRGSIIDAYVYENGVGYGSTILNLKSVPAVQIINGNSAQLNPIIFDGKIIDVQVQYGGVNYYSVPTIKTIGKGTGAEFRPIIQNKKIVDIIVINSGSGYENDTIIFVESSGKNAKFNVNIRELSVNNAYKLGKFEISTPGNFYRKTSSEVAVESPNGTLQYSVIQYSDFLMGEFNDNGLSHSPIIGWAYDGNPIYGPYGYSTPDNTSTVKLLQSGYSLNPVLVENRPSGFDSGFFIDDYIFTGNGDLDIYNGRFCKTPEFPQGTYAYFSSVGFDSFGLGTIIGKFPYFIGKYYRSNFNQLENLLLDHDFDFNSSNLIRNTLPYAVNDPYAGNDFIVESNEILSQKLIIESVNPGSLTGFNIISSGDEYKVNDTVDFYETETFESNILAKVSKLKGKNILNLSTTQNKYQNSTLIWQNSDKITVNILPYHELENNDRVVISGLSTNLSFFKNEYKIGVSTYTSFLSKSIGDSTVTGIVTNLALSNIPTKISIGSSIKINSEILSVLEVYENLSVIKVLRNSTGTSHTESSQIYFIPNSFTIKESSEFFDSKSNDLVYFNPTTSVGVGTTPGVSVGLSYYIDNVLIQTSVPTQGIYLPKHSFTTNQKVILRKPSSTSALSARNTPGGASFNIPQSGDSQVVYVINQSQDYIGIVTNVGLTTSSKGVYFVSSGSNNDLYSIESEFIQEKCTVERFKVSVVTETPHELSDNDLITLSVNPNVSVGASTISIRYNQKNNLLLTNKKSISNSGINTSENSISLSLHKFITGDKVYYESTNTVASGLSTGSYFILKIDDDKFKLSETYFDLISNPPVTVSINSIGGTGQSLSKLNPKIAVIKNNDLIFDLSDTSLVGLDLKLFYDPQLTKEFTSVSTDGSFNLIGIGTVGISSTSNLTLKYSNTLPEKLYYGLEKLGVMIAPDEEVKDYSEIVFVNSEFSRDYTVYNTYGIGSTVFNISLTRRPELLSYIESECDILEYTTTSKTSNGGVSDIKIFSSGKGYKYVPVFNKIESAGGFGAYMIAESKSIGIPKQTRIVTNGFDYPSDKTLRPEASLPSVISVKDFQTITSVNILDGGNKYLSTPDLILLNKETGNVINTGLLRANVSGSSITSVDIEISPKGLPETPVEIKSINNSNGISINQVQYSNSGIVSCILNTPISGFNQDPFSIGDKVFIEGIQKDSPSGTGFNSSDYNYQFFTVTNYVLNSNPGKLEFSISGLTTNPGIAKTIQDSFAIAINSNDYPILEPVVSPSIFSVGENIFSDNGFGFQKRDLVVKNSNESFIRAYGTYKLSVGEKIFGSESSNIATVNSINSSSAKFEISSYSRESVGWSNDTGKLSESSQVIPDNDYYQNLSYTVKSTKEWEEIVSPVNSLLHTSGLKNFADTEFITSSQVNSGILTAKDTIITLINDNINESRVDIINNFDLVIDVDVLQSN